ncbi:MAG: hypothetical protein L3J78_02960, partial [Thermoplasmata archaeon]|nr:hypothetical protein [Thermoplasmata archaeon]
AGAWPASSLSYTVAHGAPARFLLGAGTFNVTGTKVIAHLANSDLLVFKAVPVGAADKAAWRMVLDAITSGQVAAELDLVAAPDGQWMENAAEYRIDLTAWTVEVLRGKASIQMASLGSEGAVVLLAFDNATMPRSPSQLHVRANGGEVNRTNDTLTLLYASDTPVRGASYALLPFTETVLALYLPSLSSISIEVVSQPKPGPGPRFDTGSEVATIAALALVSVAAARMLRRREY